MNRVFTAAVLALAAMQAASAQNFADMTKGVREVPTARLLRNTDSVPLTSKVPNPKVKPGLVDWHASVNDALLAARTTGKPVLLLNLLGNLDEGFC